MMNDPIEQLIEEHHNILRGIKLLEFTAKMANDNLLPKQEITDLIHFFRMYADDGHHAKEEKLLFSKLIEKDKSLNSETSPIGVLNEQHVIARKLIGNISRLDNSYVFHVEDYSSLIKRHIEIEDELFPVLTNDLLDENEIVILLNGFQSEDSTRDLNNLLKILDKVEIQLL